jgi:hypothetical protein
LQPDRLSAHAQTRETKSAHSNQKISGRTWQAQTGTSLNNKSKSLRRKSLPKEETASQAHLEEIRDSYAREILRRAFQ